MRACLFAIVLVAGCLPNNRSDDFACSTSEQCGDGRTCDRGYCVRQAIDAPPPCPDACDTCDLATQECTIVCDNPSSCDDVRCPDGFECTIRCTANNACEVIDCAEAESCDVTCSGLGSCDSINCGNGACRVDCSGGSSCGIVDCASSCDCDVSCGASAICNTSCPAASVPPAVCTEDGTANTPCDSSFDATCDSC